uniref:Dynein light chain LC8-type 2 n=1 Tax=Paramormyrops kingsleyae TaxID=1676925 RepID=A0A3B3RZ74_9TELE
MLQLDRLRNGRNFRLFKELRFVGSRWTLGTGGHDLICLSERNLTEASARILSGTADKMTDRKAVIKNADMSEDMQQDAVDCATQAMEKYNIEKDIAAYIKKEFDKKYNPTWHCIVGRNFGSYVTHETKHFIYFYLGQDQLHFTHAFFFFVCVCVTRKRVRTCHESRSLKMSGHGERYWVFFG